MLRKVWAPVCALVLGLFCVIGLMGDEPAPIAVSTLPNFIALETQVVSDATITTPPGATGESFSIKNRGGFVNVDEMGSFRAEFNWLPQTIQVVNNATYKDNLVYFFGGVGEKGGILAPNYPNEVQGAVWKVQFTGNRLYLVYIDGNQQETIVKEVQLTAANNFAWDFDPPGEFHIVIEVDHVLGHIVVKGREIGNTATPNDVVLMDVTLGANDPTIQWGRNGFYNRNTTAGVSFEAQITAYTIDPFWCEPPPAGNGGGAGAGDGGMMPPPGGF